MSLSLHGVKACRYAGPRQGLTAPLEAKRDWVPKHPFEFGNKASAPCPIGCSNLAGFESRIVVWRAPNKSALGTGRAPEPAPL